VPTDGLTSLGQRRDWDWRQQSSRICSFTWTGMWLWN